MSQSPRAELASILFQEIESYLPEIDHGITSLRSNPEDTSSLTEIHRLFHNIKGAASQVFFTGLSKVASICEAIVDELQENKQVPTVSQLDFLSEVNQRISQFCDMDQKSQDDEDQLFDETLDNFHLLLEDVQSQEPVSSDELQEWISQKHEVTEHIQEPNELQYSDIQATRSQCLVSLKTILPLLQELTDCSPLLDSESLIENLLKPLSSAVTTLAECSLTAGLTGQHSLLTSFLEILDQLNNNPSLINQETPKLLQEFLSYLDIVFSLDPFEGEAIIFRIQQKLTSICGLLSEGTVPQIDSRPEDAETETSQDEHEHVALPAEETETVIQPDQQDDEASATISQEQHETESIVTPPVFADEVSPYSSSPVSLLEDNLTEEEKELYSIFQAECEDHLREINQELNTLETEVTETSTLTPTLRENVGRMRRDVHTLKGAAAMTGFESLASCAHALEDLLDWLHDTSSDIQTEDIIVIAEAIDVIELLSKSNTEAGKESATKIFTQVTSHLKSRIDAPLEEVTEEVEAVQEATEADNEIPAVLGYEEVTSQPEPIVAAQQQPQSLPADTGDVRVKLSDLDELVNIEGDLIVARGSIEKMLQKFSHTLDELDTVKDTLRRKSVELETGFEAQSLYGFGPDRGPGGDDGFMQEPSTSLSEFDPIELDRYSQLNLIIRSLNELSIDINAIFSEMSVLSSSLQGQVAKQQLAMGAMQEKLMRIRMTPLSSISRLLFRTVRQTAKQLEKNVQLTISGEDVYMDRFVWARALDPLMHILRNCVDHGIEDEPEREASGKPTAGKISVSAEQHARFIVVKISDDGRGVNTEKLREKLISEELIEQDNSLSDEDLLPYLFRPSVSTREDISQISGRGVGLDVVLKNIQELRGRVQILNSPGKGVTFVLSLPLTLSVNRAVIVSVAGQQYAVPLHDIIEVHRFSADDILAGDTPKISWNDHLIRLVDLAPSLQLKSETTIKNSSNILTLIVNTGKEHVALLFDRVLEQREIVIKDLGNHLRYVHGINGVTLTGEGTIIPILNLQEIAAGDQPIFSDTREVQHEPISLDPLKVLIVDDSISVRYSISRLVESRSWKPYQAVDGIDALEKLDEVTPDVIILDIEMPRMNGYEFMNSIRNSETHNGIPVIMLTSRASQKHQKKAEELGVDHYMTKPYQETEFIHLLETFQSNFASG